MDYIEQMTVDPDLKQRVGSLVGVVVYMLGLDCWGIQHLASS